MSASIGRRRGVGQHGIAARPGQQGQALIEFTFIFTFIMLLLAGLTDVGGLLDVHVALVYAARQGARTGAVIGNPPPTAADCAVLGAVHSVLANQPNLTVNQVTIFQAGANGVPTGKAEVYVGNVDCQNSAIVVVNSDGTTSPTTPSTDTWPSNCRDVNPFSEDSLGVKIDYAYQFQFNLLGAGPFTASDSAVYPMNVTTTSSTGTPCS